MASQILKIPKDQVSDLHEIDFGEHRSLFDIGKNQ